MFLKYLFIFLILPIHLFAQNGRITFNQITIDDGLPLNSVHSIYQDEKGFLWFATGDGLCRYDGYSFRVFNHDFRDSNSLSSDIVNSIDGDGKGNIWTASINGVDRFDTRTLKVTAHYRFLPSKKGLLSNDINKLLVDKEGLVWIGTKEGLNCLHPETGRLETYRPESPAPLNIIGRKISSLCQDQMGNIWIGTNKGISKFDKKKKAFFHIAHNPSNPLGLNSRFISCLYFDKNNNLWIGDNYGVLLKEMGDSTYAKYNLNISGTTINHINSILQSSNGHLWVGMDQGLVQFDPAKGKIINYYLHDRRDNFSLSSNNIRHIFEDHSGVLWIATIMGGLSKANLNNKNFIHFKHSPYNPNSLSSPIISCFFEDQTGDIWIGTWNDGVNQYNRANNRFKHFNDKNSSLTNDIHVFEGGDNNTLWMGSWSGHLFQCDLKTKRVIKTYVTSSEKKNAISSWTIRDILIDRKGNIWLAGDAGVEYIEKGTNKIIRVLNEHNSNGNNLIWTVFEDKEGVIWMGSDDNGCFAYDPSKKSFRHFLRGHNSINNNSVRTFYQDKKGYIWIGTAGGGLNRFDKKTGSFKYYNEQDGLCNNNIYGILEEKNGDLWISTNHGLSRFSFTSGYFKNYYASDGLQSDQFLFNAYYKCRDGALLFGGLNGFNLFYPEKIKTNPIPPRVVLTDLKVFNSSVPIGKMKDGNTLLTQTISDTKELSLSYKYNVITFEFAALHFANPQKHQYKYKLEGFDEDWVEARAGQRFANYTNLDGGSYTFKVKGSNNDGVWGNEASLQLVVLPPFWKTLWFNILLVALVLIAIVMISHMRERSIKRRNEVLEDLVRKRTAEIENQKDEIQAMAEKVHGADQLKLRFFTNISHEFRTPLTLILGPLDRIKNSLTHESHVRQMTLVQKNARRLLDLVNQLLDLRKLETGSMKINPSAGELVSFVRNISHSFDFTAESKKILFTVKASPEEINRNFDKDKIEKIIYNLLSNAFKFTPENGNVIIKISSSSENDPVIITIEDNGIGIPEHEIPKVFDRFYQISNQHLKNNPGTGIGLALVKDLVDLQNGKINLESEEGKFTRITIELPLDHSTTGHSFDEEPEISQPLDPASAILDQEEEEDFKTGDPSRVQILVTEDNEDVREYLKTILIEEYDVILAKNGKEGWEKACETIPDIIISDVMMPEMDGIEFCNKIKSDERTNHIPLILLTARASDEFKLKGLEKGADEYITKPFNEQILLLKIRNLLALRERVREHFNNKQVIVKPSDVVIAPAEEVFIDKAVKIIEQYISNPEFGVETFCHEMGMSRANLYRKIQAITGKSINEFIRFIRLQRAAQLLTTKRFAVNEIADQVGFQDTSYFARCFKKQFGKYPKEWS